MAGLLVRLAPRPRAALRDRRRDRSGPSGVRRLGLARRSAGRRVHTEILADDLLALLDGLGISHVVGAAYDIGATVAQTLALRRPERIKALALFNPAYPGIGERRFESVSRPSAGTRQPPSSPSGSPIWPAKPWRREGAE
jgi:pimeloyl-ACP methyl ester carboxylesterase